MRVLRLDSQILSAMSRCPRMAEYRFVQNLIRKEGENEKLLMGSAVHLGLEHYYLAQKDNLPFAERVERGLEKAYAFMEEKGLPSDKRDTVMNTLADYYKYRRDDRMIILEVEVPFSSPIYEGKDFQGEDIRILYEGKIDLIADEAGERVVIDHKTTSVNYDPLDLRTQFLGYAWATGCRVVVNRVGFQKTLKPEEKFRRFYMKYDQNLIHDFETYVISKALEWANHLQDEFFPQNFASCDAKYGPCTYVNLCRYPTLIDETKRFEFSIGEPWDVFKEINT